MSRDSGLRILPLEKGQGLNWGLTVSERWPQITGGDLYIRRALADTHATTIEQLGAEIQIAQDYGRYLANKDVIDTIIAQDPASAFAAGWVITLLRAEELGITHIQRSDFNGGMADFLGSYDLSRFAASECNIVVPNDNAPWTQQQVAA